MDGHHFFAVPGFLIDHIAHLTPAELRIYLALCWAAYPGLVTQISTAELQRQTGIKAEANVRLAMRRLCDLGFVRVAMSSRGGKAKIYDLSVSHAPQDQPG